METNPKNHQESQPEKSVVDRLGARSVLRPRSIKNMDESLFHVQAQLRCEPPESDEFTNHLGMGCDLDPTRQ